MAKVASYAHEEEFQEKLTEKIKKQHIAFHKNVKKSKNQNNRKNKSNQQNKDKYANVLDDSAFQPG